MDVREDGKNNTLGAGKSAACDENEVWDCMYHLIDIWCVIQKVSLQALENHELGLENCGASFGITELQLNQQRLGMLFDI